MGGEEEGERAGGGLPRERASTVPEQQQHLESIESFFCAFFA